MQHNYRSLSLSIAFAFTLSAPGGLLRAQDRVYAMTNAATANAILVYDRSVTGMLAPMGSFATGGQGTGSGLGSQGSVVLDNENRHLFAVNAGSNEISVFLVTPSGLALLGKSDAGGMEPISLTVHDNSLFVLDAGGDGNITGFRILPNGNLAPIAGSTRPLSSTASGPAEISFAPDGEALIVTEKTTNLIDVYRFFNDHIVSGPVAHVSHGETPFGFAFDARGNLIVSEAFNAAPDGSAVSSYDLTETDDLRLISASVPTHQTAACWVAVTGNGHFAYTTDTDSNVVSGFFVRQAGAVSLLVPSGATASTGSLPTDMAFNATSRFLYVLSAGSGVVNVFHVRLDGGLDPIQQATGIPASASGIAAH